MWRLGSRERSPFIPYSADQSDNALVDVEVKMLRHGFAAAVALVALFSGTAAIVQSTAALAACAGRYCGAN
jgi:hypothetical protein